MRQVRRTGVPTLTGRDKGKNPRTISDCQNRGANWAVKEKAPRFLQGLIFILFSLSTSWVAQASPLATENIILPFILEVKSAAWGFAFIPCRQARNICFPGVA